MQCNAATAAKINAKFFKNMRCADVIGNYFANFLGSINRHFVQFLTLAKGNVHNPQQSWLIPKFGVDLHQQIQALCTPYNPQ
jgi:hypothetical protein